MIALLSLNEMRPGLICPGRIDAFALPMAQNEMFRPTPAVKYETSSSRLPSSPSISVL